MAQAAGSLVAIAVLGLAGLVLARRGLLPPRAVDGLKLLITRLTLPVLLFGAFVRLEPDGRNAALAAVVFGLCAVMGALGAGLSRLGRLPLVGALPRPETRLLFQGFEAGMLGYALFVALHSSEHLPAFAALDMGQVVYVFTALMVQMSMLGRAADGATGGAADGPADGDGVGIGGRARFPWRDLATSAVLWAIGVGLVIAVTAPGLAEWVTAPDGVVAPFLATVGGLTTPLVCLVIGASLADGVPRDRAIVTIVALRTLVGLGLGLVVALVLVPALGFSDWYARAAIVLFVLPAPFVIPVYYRRSAAFVGGVLTLSTAVSIAVIAVLAVAGVA